MRAFFPPRYLVDVKTAFTLNEFPVCRSFFRIEPEQTQKEEQLSKTKAPQIFNRRPTADVHGHKEQRKADREGLACHLH